MTRRTFGPSKHHGHLTETQILNAITEYLEVLQNMGKVLYIRHNPVRVINRGGGVRIVKGRESQRGAPDLFVWLGPKYDGFIDSISVAVETKTPSGTLSEDQKRWQLKAHNIGLNYLVVRSLDEFKKQTGL